MIDHVDGLDLSGVPIPFLEAHPFPAFVLVVRLLTQSRPRFLSRDTDVTVRRYEDEKPPPVAGQPAHNRPVTSSTVAWGNEKWLQLLAGRSIDECLTLRTVNRLQAWIEGDESPYNAEKAVFVLELQEPPVVLHLAKTFVPLTPPSLTHTFCIMTSQVQQGSLYQSPPPESSPSPGPLSSLAITNRTRTSPASDLRTSISTDVGSSVSDKVPEGTAAGGSYFPSSASGTSGVRSNRARNKGAKRAPYGEKPTLTQHMQRSLEECWAMVDAIDWAATELGPRYHWADGVDPLLSVTFQSQTQDVVWLGPQLRLLYNKNYSVLVDHPTAFGQPGREVWASIWDQLSPAIDEAMAGKAVYRENEMFGFAKWGDGHLLESYHTWRFVPILDKDKVVGFFNQSMDTSEQVLAARRLGTVRELSDQMFIARSSAEYFASIADAFEQNPKDAPFIMCYSIHQKPKDPEAAHIDVEAILESSVGVPLGHPSAPDNLELKVPLKSRLNFGPKADRLSSPTLSAISAMSSGSGRMHHTSEGDLVWPIAKALATRQPVVLTDCRVLVEGLPLRVWEKLPFSAIVVPICSESTLDIPQAVIILGLSVRRPFDAEYDSWVHVIRSQLASSLVSVRAFEEEHKRQEEAIKMERAKAAWFRGAAHDLRSPLTLINGPVEDLLSSDLTPAQTANAQIAKRNIDRLMRLVNSLMDFSRLEAGRVEGRFAPTDLGAFVSDLAQLFRSAVERMKIEYHIIVEPSDRLVYVDSTLLETVISNLIGNALKYTESGSITVQLKYSEEYAEVSVIDTGVGIPSSEIGQVTEWYHRASTAIHSGTTGTGLGLALAKELLRLHDGHLIYTSECATESEQHGSTFTAQIPLKSRLASSLDHTETKFGSYGKAIAKEALRWTRDDQTDGSSEGAGSTHESPTLSRGVDGFMFEKTDRILVVDDNADMREYLRRIFLPYCKVTEARDGLDAVGKAIADPPDLILTDVMTPRMSGLELLEKLRANPTTSLVPTIIASAVQGDEAKVDALIMGAEDYISKPFKPKELLARVHLHMQVGKKRIKLEKLYSERSIQVSVLSDYCPSGIMRANAAGHVTYTNKAWRTMSHMPDDVDPDSWPSYVDEETRTRLGTAWEAYLSGTEKEILLKWRWKETGVNVSGLFIRLDKVAPGMSGIMGCLTDITHEEERIKEAEQRRLEAEESKHQQELLIDLTSHEIRTPVSAILQCSSLVKENLVALKEQLKLSAQIGFRPTKELLDDLEEDVEALESIYQCGLVQERIAGDVLSLARIQLDMLSLHDVEMDLKREAKKVLSVFASEAKMKKIDLVLEFGDTMDMAKVAGIKTDPVRLGQVVTNLISNAIRFTATSDVRRITVTYNVSFLPPADDTCALPSMIGAPAMLPAPEDTPIWLFVSVRDTGPGLGPKELAMLFKRFSQGNKMIHTRYGGSGLGLFICKKITEMLGGRIEVKSQLGEGSTFRFFVQTRTLSPPSALAAMIEATSLMPSSNMTRSSSSFTSASSLITTGTPISTGSPAPPGAGAESMHILIVEDNIINQTVLKRQIIKAGLTCDVANNGLEALNHIREADRQAKRGVIPTRKKLYDVVLMDLEMPIMDGLTAIREIRAAEAAGTLGRNMVIALTGNARQGQIDQAMAAGMDDVVIKPYVLGNLLQKIHVMSARKAELESMRDD